MMANKIIDVSQWQGRIDWEKVKQSGIDGAIIRCGFGSDIASQDDPQFERNADECERLGIPYGVYLYSYAKNEDMARSEAAHALRLCKGRKLSYPIYFDTEENGTQSVSKACAIAFCEAIEDAGYWAGVYASLSWWQTYLNGLDAYTKWVAQWGAAKVGMACDMWQYTSDGTVNGIGGRVDMNYCYRDFPKEINGTAKKPTSTAKPAKKPAASKKKKSIATIANEVIAGKWGNGDTRKKKLKAAGYDYSKVQAKVNEIMAAKVLEVGALIRIKSGAHMYGTTTVFASWVYSTTYKVVEIMGNRVVFATTDSNTVIGAVAKRNCVVQ